MIFPTVLCVFASVFIIGCVRLDQLNTLPDCSGNYASDRIESMVFVSTLDGRVTALNGHAGGTMKWNFEAGSDPLLSSSIHKLELTNNGHWVRMIPSLSGGLYKFDGVNIEMLPVRADHLLQSSSFLLNDGLVISGGRETSLYSIAIETGEVLYECSMKGCDNFKNISNNMIIIQRHSQTVRAIDIHTGNERWNFSVGQHEVKMALNSASCHLKHAEHIPHLDIKAIIPEGLVYAVQKAQPHRILWQHKFTSPVVAIWEMEHGKINSIDLFQDNVWSTTENTPNMSPALYLGMHRKQLYIQESLSLQTNLKKTTHLIEIDVSRKNLQVPWEPIPVTSTALGMVERPIVDAEYEKDVPNSALYSLEYVNGNGYFLFNKDTDLMKPGEQCRAGEETNKSDGTDEFENEQEIPVHVIVSLWYWWKEVLIISITTAVLVNVIVTQRVLQMVQEPGEKEVIFVEKLALFENQTPADDEMPSGSCINGSDSRNVEYMSRYLLDFEPVQCLGKGGFGVVFEAKNKIDECNYAIKRIALPNSLESRVRVLREVKALAKLDHQHIVRYFNAWMECPPSGWQDYHDSMHIKMNQSDPAILSSTSASENHADGSIQFFCMEKINNVTVSAERSCNACEENDSFIIFENSQSTNAYEQTEHTSVNVEGTWTDVCSSLDSYESQPHCNDQCSEETYSKVISVNVVPSPTRMYLYIQMQLCLKKSLREWLCENVTNRDRKKMLQMFEQIVQAVEYIHLEGLIHRDLKPSNIFFSMSGQIKVGDFGLVTAMTKNVTGNLFEIKNKCDIDGKHTAQVGTELYMSPEQVEWLPYDYKVDIYSLGIILFELLYPFSTQMERCNVLLALRRSAFPESFKHDFNEEYELLKLMLSHNPEKRPTTFGIRARPPFTSSANEEEATSTQWHFTLPIHSRPTNQYLSNV